MKSIHDADYEISLFERLIRDKPDYIDALKPLAEAYTQKGEYQKGLEVDKRLSELCPDDPVVIYNLACSYALMGAKQDALQTIRRAVELGYRDFRHMKRDPDLSVLRGEPEFDEIVKVK